MFSLAPELSNPEPLFTFGNIIQFRPSRLFFFIVYFIPSNTNGLSAASFRATFKPG
jgi:hypothetical protein